ncbi:MAG: threonine dehydrogenase [Actinomycetia bacterium]|nr:threonine dehydrogenase [Actinomycetes bacterium]
MQAAVLGAPGQTSVETCAFPDPQEDEVVVRVEGCGVCASSLPVWEGRPWFDYPLAAGAPGHEAWGVELETAKPVAILSQHAFAEYVAVRPSRLVALPPELVGRPFPGEALGCAVNVFARSGVSAGDTVAVVGTGFLGLLLVQLCVGAGARTLAFSRRESSLELARVFGAETPAQTLEQTCDVAIEAAGAQETLDVAARLCRTRGRLVIAGYHQDGLRAVDLQLWNWRGLDVVNAHERDEVIAVEGIRAALAAVRVGQLDPSPLYTHTFPIEQIDEAFELLRSRPPGFVKALVAIA